MKIKSISPVRVTVGNRTYSFSPTSFTDVPDEVGRYLLASTGRFSSPGINEEPHAPCANVHVLTPFYRRHLTKTLLHYYGAMNIIWHPICDSVDIEPFKGNTLPWVKPLLCPPLVIGRDQCYRKFNDFIDAGDIVDEDYYTFCGDDDMFEPGFFDVIKRQRTSVIFTSNYRGDAIPDDGGAPHPTTPLIMRTPDDVRCCNIGLGMFVVKGFVLKNTRFRNDDGCNDGHYAEDLKCRWANSLTFLPNWFVFGNFFQPGRHTDKKKFLKPTWELPIFK